jgi:hypothetical protein
MYIVYIILQDEIPHEIIHVKDFFPKTPLVFSFGEDFRNR